MSHPTLLSEDQIRQMLRGITVPPQPQIIVDIHMEQAMPKPDIDHIARLISQDVGLSGSILKAVNSSLLNRKNRITSVEQAVHILGLESIIRLIEGLSLKTHLHDEAVIAMGGFWDSAMEIATACAAISRAIGYQAPDKAYCLGLFHNCGVPLLMKNFSDYGDVMELSYRMQGERVIDVENRKLKTNHAVVGYFVAKSWNLPGDLCEVIAEHHSAQSIFSGNPLLNYDGGKKTLLAILKMAEHICGIHRTLGKQARDHEWESIQAQVLDFVGLSEPDFLDIAAELHDYATPSMTTFSDVKAS
jgi:HD-like signal output (HDOD) protein